jgi:hypothetical protein
MQTQYDAGVLQQFADDLYARARRIVFTTALVYTFVGFVGSAILISFLKLSARTADSNAAGWILFFTLVSCAIGVSSGRAKAFQLKLQAQQTLCQRQIEINLRPATKANAVHA